MSAAAQPVRVGFVGAGAIAGVHLDAVTRVPGALAVGVTDRDGTRARALASRVRGLRAFPDLGSMLAAGVDVVHVLTPPQAHAAAAVEAIEARMPRAGREAARHQPGRMRGRRRGRGATRAPGRR